MVKFSLRQGETAFEHPQAAPERPGIYIPAIAFPKTGDWQAALLIPTGGTNAIVELGTIKVYTNEQSAARAEVPLIDESEARTKFNPLADWTWGDVWHYIAQNRVDYHPLHDEFYPSIGCAPCTRAISLGEDFRAGRWWWEDASKKECGLHVHQ